MYFSFLILTAILFLHSACENLFPEELYPVYAQNLSDEFYLDFTRIPEALIPDEKTAEVLQTKDSQEPQELWASAAVVYDAEAGRVLFGKNPTEQLPMASTTKIMTLLVILENSDPDEIVTVSKKASSQPEVHLGMRAGEQYRLKDLCYSLMLESHNDSAVALAEHVGGSVEGFAELMNQKALSLGAFHTHFVTPNGLDADGHYSTAEDLAKIAAYAVKQEKFQAITTAADHSFSDLSGKRSFSVTNKNRFLTMMDGAIGVKTGFTGKAGYCFVGAIKRADRTLISVVLASRWPPYKEAKWSDTKKLMNYGLNAYSKVYLRDYFQSTENTQGTEYENGVAGYSKNTETRQQPACENSKNEQQTAWADQLERLQLLPKLRLRNASEQELPLCYSEQETKELFETSLLMKPSEEISFQLLLSAQELTAPVKAGEQVGMLFVALDGYLIKKIPVLTAQAAEPVDFIHYFKKALHYFLTASNSPARRSAASIFSQKLSFPTIVMKPFFSMMERGWERT